jgi:hypothetical protein
MTLRSPSLLLRTGAPRERRGIRHYTTLATQAHTPYNSTYHTNPHNTQNPTHLIRPAVSSLCFEMLNNPQESLLATLDRDEEGREGHHTPLNPTHHTTQNPTHLIWYNMTPLCFEILYDP